MLIVVQEGLSCVSQQQIQYRFTVIVSEKFKLNFKPSGAEASILQKNCINTIAADALALCIARLSVALVLTIQDKLFLVFQEEGFQLPDAHEC